MTEGRARTVFIGSGGFGRETLWRLGEHPDVELVGVVTAPPRPAGRGGRTTVTPIHEAARHLEVRPILTPARLRDAAALAAYSRPSRRTSSSSPTTARSCPPALLDLRTRRVEPASIAAAALSRARRRSRRRSWPATPRPASRSCAWTPGLDTGPDRGPDARPRSTATRRRRCSRRRSRWRRPRC